MKLMTHCIGESATFDLLVQGEIMTNSCLDKLLTAVGIYGEQWCIASDKNTKYGLPISEENC